MNGFDQLFKTNVIYVIRESGCKFIKSVMIY